MRAAEQGIQLTDLKVVATSESDDRGLVGLDEVEAGPRSVIVQIPAASDAPEDKLREVVDWAEAHSPVGDALRREIPVKVEVEIGQEAG